MCMTREMATETALDACMISNWYPKLNQYTFLTSFVSLPDEFVEWLLADGIFVPPTSTAFPTRNKQNAFATGDDYRDWSTDEDDEEEDVYSRFASLIDRINTSIQDLGGHVVPKLTWSVPKDATWMAVGNTLRCSTADQIFLLLKSSDRIAHDLTENSKSNHVLALRKWYDLRPGREFRCFVIGRSQLVAACQRDVSQRFDELIDEYDSIKQRIIEFHTNVFSQNSNNVCEIVPDEFVYDCYVPTMANAGVKLIDINPFGPGSTTSPLLFEWNEILQIEKLISSDKNDTIHGMSNNNMGCRIEGESEKDGGSSDIDVEFRIVREDVALRPADTALYGVPYDFVDLSEGSALSALMEHAKQGNMY